jgi:FtsP/CotA-like multicopper oxidase with cupredoxin domain
MNTSVWSYQLTRRTLLQTLGVITAASGATALLQAYGAPVQPAVPAVPSTGGATSTFVPDVEIKLTASQGETDILPGAATTTWSYHGEVIQGEASSVVNLPDSYLGPLLRLHKGQKVRIHLQNELPEETIIHWHGLVVPPEMDGHPTDAVASGQSYRYEFEVKNRAGAYWFHPHPHGTTAKQVNWGLAGLLIVQDEEEAALGLPGGDYDLALVLQDRTFDALNQFVYEADAMEHSGEHSGETESMNMESMMGFLGEQILVNGRPNFTLLVVTRAYRLRLLNGSNSRIYKLAWSNGMPLTVIASDGGLLAKPLQRDYVTLSPGERVELWADFSQMATGDEIKLRSLAYSGVEAGMLMGGMMTMPMSSLPNGAPFDVLTVRVERTEQATHTLPAQLSDLHVNRPEDAANLASPRLFELGMENMQWLINGKRFEMEEVEASEVVAFNSLEVWEFVNQQGVEGMGGMGGGMSGMQHNHQGASTGNMGMQGMMNDFMAHPMHVHGVQFQVIERQIHPAYADGWATLKDGFVDEGWKDTVLVMPGERVKILARFYEYRGRYLVHCHNLEHESTGMMRNFLVA